MDELSASRPYMPGYGILGPTGAGAAAVVMGGETPRFPTTTGVASRRVASRWPDGRPHLMPVWGVWQDDALWSSSSGRSRKARNLRSDPRCSVAPTTPSRPWWSRAWPSS